MMLYTACVDCELRPSVIVALINKAIERDGPKITTTCGHKSFSECINIFNGKAYLYYNIEGNTTHVVTTELEEHDYVLHNVN